MIKAEISRDGTAITVRVPLTVRKRGGRKLVVLPAGEEHWAPSRPSVDTTLVRLLARAHRWQGLLESGVYSSLREITAAENISHSYVGRVLQLTLLSPDMVEAILDGRQSATLISGQMTN